MPMKSDTVPVIAEHVTTRHLSGEAFIMNLETGKTFALNETGTFIWSSIDGARTIQNIIDRVTSEYDVTGDEARNAVNGLVVRLGAENLLVLPDLNE